MASLACAQTPLDFKSPENATIEELYALELANYDASWDYAYTDEFYDWNQQALLRAQELEVDSLEYTFRIWDVRSHSQKGEHYKSLRALDDIRLSSLQGTHSDSFAYFYHNFETLINLKLYDQAVAFIPVHTQFIQPEDPADFKRDQMINIWNKGKFWHKLIPITKEKIAYLIEKGDSIEARTHMNNLGVYLSESNQLDAAIDQWESTLAFIVEVNEIDYVHQQLIPVITSNIGSVYYEKKEYKKAIELLRQDLNSYHTPQITGPLNSMLQIGDSFRSLGQLDSAHFYADQLKKQMTPHIGTSFYENYLEFLSKLSRDEGNHHKAAIIYQKMRAHRDSVFGVDQKQGSDALNYLLDIETLKELAKEQEIRAERELKSASSAQNERNNAVIGGLISFLFLFFGVVFLVLQKRSTRFKTNQKNQISEQKAFIEQTLENKQLLLNEIHHRVKNNLQVVYGLLHLQSESTDFQATKDSLELGQTRIRSMGLIHEMLYEQEDFTHIQLSIYMKRLVRELLLSKGLSPQNQKIQLDPIRVHLDQAIPLGLMLNELVGSIIDSNFLHKELNLVIGLKQVDSKRSELTISEDNVRLQTSTSLSKLRIKIMSLFGEPLEADVAFKEGKGTHCVIRYNNFNR